MKNNILITSAGRRVNLVKAFINELNNVFPQSKLVSVDSNPEYSPACRVSDKYFKIQKINAPDYISELLRISLENDVKIIIPTIDTELLILSENRDLFKINGIEVIISNYEMIKIFRDKRLTNQFFENSGIGFAKEYSKNNYKLPLYIKPIDGSRSINNFTILNKSDLNDFHFQNDKLMFLEYFDHNKYSEFTIDLYYDKNSNLKSMIPRKRIEVRDGEVSKGLTVKDDSISKIWQKISFIPGLRGCINLQIFLNNETKEIYGIEINPRFGGGYLLTYLAGANFPKWIIQEYLLGVNDIPIYSDWEENLLMLRYDNEVLVHNFKV